MLQAVAQQASEALNLSGLSVTSDGATLGVAGALVYAGSVFSVDESYPLVEGEPFQVYTTVDGLLSTNPEQAVAHVAWWDGVDTVTYIDHT